MHTITVVGLGPGEKAQMPLNVYESLRKAAPLFLRTAQHPVVEELTAEGLKFESFDSLYEEQTDDFDSVYAHIVSRLIQEAQTRNVVYAVPGHPMVAEKSVKLLLDQYDKVDILDGKSFLDDFFNAVQIDPVEGFQLLDSFELHADFVQTGQHVIVMQVFNALMAGEVKLTLMDKYPDDHPVALIDAAGTEAEKVDWMPLYEMDRFQGVHNLRSLYVPPLEQDEQVTSLSTLQYYIDQITAPEGDAWINEQTARSLIPYLKEETTELVAAIEKEDTDNWMEELGDVLVQILYQTGIAEKDGVFTFEEVLENVNRKIRRRHPHVFDGVEASTPEEVDVLWQKIKKEEKRLKDET
ncbi:putative tetrapyrrole methyltransferase [Alkalibacterium sp. AK22]|uniref:MazG nucleotide pyrophosphohydrolase domain-containing protein n=1 Tax=Alkalibacterium sp. AK22 TaxID=1229520 RepID=UPI00044835E1|nr:MazG nucleotide pyrophosphohydrolase domain-containing protein [Alkalibacterium sp. AK22]EXJ23440.1 putative tetrapyrrole methyltransferase [Alkalibacterium sp. AK22]